MKIHESVSLFTNDLVEKNIFTAEEVEGFQGLFYTGDEYLNIKIKVCSELEMGMNSLSEYNQCLLMFRIQLFGSLIEDGTMTYDDSLLSKVLLYIDHLLLYIFLCMDHIAHELQKDMGIVDKTPIYH